MEMVKDIAAIIGLISAAIGLIVTIFKPFRKAIIAGITHKNREDETSQKLDLVVHKIESMERDVSELKTDIKSLNNRVDEIQKNVLENEVDRLKSELFNCGNRCRRSIKLYPEEFAHIRDVYHKYSDKLKQNHEGTLEFEYILDYYNSQNLNDTK